MLGTFGVIGEVLVRLGSTRMRKFCPHRSGLRSPTRVGLASRESTPRVDFLVHNSGGVYQWGPTQRPRRDEGTRQRNPSLGLPRGGFILTGNSSIVHSTLLPSLPWVRPLRTTCQLAQRHDARVWLAT
ncbi:hypothetical protein GW17_00036737 [Ensete ventricosum]|nr:hypothetical protein GW17_00036737 [Ensete ventricosum]